MVEERRSEWLVPAGAPHAFATWKNRERDYADTTPIPPKSTAASSAVGCRNPRCGAQLRRETSNPRDAFCCRGCFELHYRKLCVVCERPLRRKPARKAGRPTQFCQPEMQGRVPPAFSPVGGEMGGAPYLPYRAQPEIPPEVPVKRASKHEPRPDRPGAWWPAPAPISTRSIWPCQSRP